MAGRGCLALGALWNGWGTSETWDEVGGTEREEEEGATSEVWVELPPLSLGGSGAMSCGLRGDSPDVGECAWAEGKMPAAKGSRVVTGCW